MKVFFVYPIFKKIFIRADVVQAISNYLADWARSMGRRDRVEVIPNGVDVSKFSGDTAKMEENVILITTSRLVKKNGVADIIDALKLLPERVKLKIIGSGPLDRSLKTKTRGLGLEGRVKFLGHMEHGEMVGHLRASHIFVRPSLSEGMGNSFIEAMAAGLPVIATPVGGIPDFLVDPDKSPERHPTGLFVPPRSPKDIAKAVERLMKNDRLRETLVVNGKRLAKDKYDWNLIAEEMKKRVF
jgi:glycosyltransferase involved in cell wall biosynthesis